MNANDMLNSRFKLITHTKSVFANRGCRGFGTPCNIFKPVCSDQCDSEVSGGRSISDWEGKTRLISTVLSLFHFPTLLFSKVAAVPMVQSGFIKFSCKILGGHGVSSVLEMRQRRRR